MKYRAKKHQKIAIALLFIIGLNILLPPAALALTSGPTQPEAKGFQPAGVADMVDLQTGDLKYNIPLLDIDGYPINLNYASGGGIDDEASWVGSGWSLNPGAINRQVRGIPDDFSGDQVEVDHWTKPKVTVGGKATVKVETFGGKLNGTFSLGLFSDNYTGIGAELGVNGGISVGFANSGAMTAGLGAGVTSNTASGVDVDISPYVSLSVKEGSTTRMTESAGLSGTLGYNSRSGMKSLSLSTSFSPSLSTEAGSGSGSYTTSSSTINYNTEPLSPSTQIPYTSTYSSFSFNVGGEVIGIAPAIGGMGYKSVRQVTNFVNTKPAYGFLYAENGKSDPHAQMDFIREKDNPIIKGIPNIAIPIHTPDVWSYSSQSGSGQFRLFRGGSGAFFDNEADDQSGMSTAGVDIGVGSYVHGGLTQFTQATNNVTRKWTSDNAYLAKGDFQNKITTNPTPQHVYFRQTGEKNLEDWEVNKEIMNDQAVAVHIDNKSAVAGFNDAANPSGTPTTAETITDPIAKMLYKRNNRTNISYQTADEAQYGGLDKAILNYDFNDISTFGSTTPAAEPIPIESLPRVDANHKKHHISELTITDDGGKRMVYGLPVYNLVQSETSFAVSPENGSGTIAYNADGLIGVPPFFSTPGAAVNNYGIDNYYHKESKPAYATSYLLTAILSPDYVDKTGDGVSADDLGTAIKFNYSKLGHTYRWRAPYLGATLNKGLLADPDDDKGSIVYGEKEIWHVSSIETKTKIAYFITQDRTDALGVADWQQGGKDDAQTQKCLREIRLYSKGDMTRPIKVVKFEYDYSLCPNIPNSAGWVAAPTTDHPFAGTGPGKLTLRKVWFEYGNSDKGSHHPYRFAYNSGTTQYANMMTDRWGNYKTNSENPNSLDNEHYPYSDQVASNVNCAVWHLQSIGLPTGGTINVTYEPGDYAYVQDKKAMAMVPVLGLIPDPAKSSPRSDFMNDAMGVQINIGAGNGAPSDPADQLNWFNENYLGGSGYLYTKMFLQFTNPDNGHPFGETDPKERDYDYVPCYAKVHAVSIDPTTGATSITFEPMTEGGVTTNPVSIAAWQRMKNEYPKYAYPGFDNRLKTAGGSIPGAVAAIVAAAKNLSELTESFYSKANRKSYASHIHFPESFVRIAKGNGKKLGGPPRVARIQMVDNWNIMNGSGETNAYGQAYTYTTAEGISSGVAAYEPSIGNDENPLRQPVEYVQKVAGGINNYFDLEKPFGESLYPAAQVVYSRVTVHDLDRNQQPSSETGYTVNECFTAKDYPVKVTVLPLQSNPVVSSHYSLLGTNSTDELTLSQGYSIELNDMHGKPKATRTYNKAGAEISSTVYSYNSVDNGGTQSLNNKVNVIDKEGDQHLRYIGRDIELFTDFREQESSNQGQTINIGGDIFGVTFPPFILGFPHIPVSDNNEYKLFRSASALKVIQNYGIMTKVVKTQNGSSITTENLAFDGVTGEALVTRTQNEFNNNIYTVNIPAYWAYDGMGGSYHTSDVEISDLKTDQFGVITDDTYRKFFKPGDELLNKKTGERYWVGISSPVSDGSCATCTMKNLPKNKNEVYYANNETRTAHGPSASEDAEIAPMPDLLSPGGQDFLIDRNGAIVKNLNVFVAGNTVKVVRSGFRNMLTPGAMSVVSLANPIVGNHLQLTAGGNQEALKVVNTSASTFNDTWAVKPACSNNHTTEDLTTLGLNGFKLQTTPLNANHAMNGGYIYDNSGSNVGYTSINSWGSQLNLRAQFDAAGVWVGNAVSGQTLGNQVGFETDITIPAGTYYIGYSGDDHFNYVFDKGTPNEVTLPQPSIGSVVEYWFICPVTFSGTGKHHLTATGINDSSSSNTLSNNPGTLSLEIYKTSLTIPDFQNPATVYNSSNILFSTHDLVAAPAQTVQTFADVSNPGLPIQHAVRYNYKHCINPYVDGFLGNWRPEKTMVFQQSRHYDPGLFASTNKGVSAQDAGYINLFTPFWYRGTVGSTVQWEPNFTNRWVAANTVTGYDKYGQQTENEDALQRYSAADFNFNGELPSAVASNAKKRELYTNSFEDVLFDPGTVTQTCSTIDFNFPHSAISHTVSHTGNYSLLLPAGGITMSTNSYVVPPPPTDLLVRSYLGEYNVQKDSVTQVDVDGIYPQGFEPVSGQDYLFDVWVHDGQPINKNVNISLTIGSTSGSFTTSTLLSGLACKAVVEGWKLIEVKLPGSLFGANAITINIAAIGGATVYIDDLRIHPYTSQVKTYVYDDKTLRLMAELDENCFATFYEYDDEGLLVRVKKETEKGVMTLKESRSSYPKQ